MQSINPYKKEDLQLLKDNIQLFSNDVIDKLLYFINMEERKSEQEYQVIVGYVTIAFWSCVLLFALYKKITTKKTNH